MMNRDSKVWWHPRARRVVGWGAAGAALWGLPAAVFLGYWASDIYWYSSPPAEEQWFVFSGYPLLQILFWFAGGSSVFLALMGALTGGFAALCAPVTDSMNPLKSRVFWSLRRQTFYHTFAASLVCGHTLNFLELAFFQNGELWVFWIWLTLTVASSFLFLWRAVNRAIHAATASDCSA